ncbi:unnamed protein product [Blepharisma stoltei]|uniref:Phosphoribulokinase/uridine kinase domain-containing protein n=1 Tax=Blepharisma stoltei TaxID=1481888 RepID=A0AAU9KB02_9CILI|nr:unnamed protein product [Blepharisma stoltei]
MEQFSPLNQPYYSPIISPSMPLSLGLTSGFNLRQEQNSLAKSPFIIGICGGSCSGKSLIADTLKRSLDFSASVVNEFDFYMPTENQTPDYTHNFDDPNAIDWESLKACLESLNGHRPFDCPQYNLEKQKKKKKTIKIFPTPVVIIEGLFLFCKPEIRELIDMKIFVDCPDDVRLGHRVRKFIGRGLYTLQFITDYYQKYTKPAFEQYIEPSKVHADLIIPNFGIFNNSKDVESMVSHIANAIYGRQPPTELINRLRYAPMRIAFRGKEPTLLDI